MVDKVQGEKFYTYIQKNKGLGYQDLLKSKKDFLVMDRAQWKELTSTKDREKIRGEYKQAFIELGESFNKYLDEKFGDGDGKLVFDEFKKANLYGDKKRDKFLQDAFKNFDIDGDNEISSKEWAAFFHMVDRSVNNNRKSCPDAKIDAFSLIEGFKEMNQKEVGTIVKDIFNNLFSD